MAKEISIERKIKQMRRGSRIFDYFTVLFILVGILQIGKTIGAYQELAATIERTAELEIEHITSSYLLFGKIGIVIQVIFWGSIAYGFRAIRNLFRTVADVLEELRTTV